VRARIGDARPDSDSVPGMSRALLLVALVVAALASLVWSKHVEAPPKASGFVEADEIRLGSRVGGRVKTVRAVEGAAVKKDDVLVELEAFDLAERRAEAVAFAHQRREEAARVAAGARPEEIRAAQARRDSAAARLARLVKGPRAQEIDAARANLAVAQATLDLATKSLTRAKTMYASSAIAVEDLDRAVEAQKVAEAVVLARKSDLALLEEGSRAEDVDAAKAETAEAAAALELLERGSRAEDVAASKAAADAADAALAAIDRQIEELTVRAPTDGVVDAVDLRPGDIIAPNAPVLSIVDPSRLWVRAYLPEDRIDVKNGAALDVSVDAFPARRFKAHVSFVARQAEFTPGNVQTPDERSKQVFRVKVQLDEGLDVLRPGMSADVWLPPR
jgi:HlyD family secretion protein